MRVVAAKCLACSLLQLPYVAVGGNACGGRSTGVPSTGRQATSQLPPADRAVLGGPAAPGSEWRRELMPRATFAIVGASPLRTAQPGQSRAGTSSILRFTGLMGAASPASCAPCRSGNPWQTLQTTSAPRIVDRHAKVRANFRQRKCEASDVGSTMKARAEPGPASSLREQRRTGPRGQVCKTVSKFRLEQALDRVRGKFCAASFGGSGSRRLAS